MPKIIPIKELKDTASISLMVRESAEPVYITKNGYGDMVIMSTEEYDRMVFELDVYAKLLEGEKDIQNGNVENALDTIDRLRRRYDL